MRMASEYAPLQEQSREVDEVEAPTVVDWETPKDAALAKKYHHTLMARCSMESDGVREVLDIGAGYKAIDPKSIHKWPLWSTTHDELGKIGGAGALVYFELLYRLRFVFGIMALLNTPSLFLNVYGERNMYDSELLTRQYKTWTARTTLGSVYADETILDNDAGLFSGHAGGMWVRTLMDAICVAFFAKFIVQWKRDRNVLSEKADHAACSMADYTVSVRPQADWSTKFDRSLDDDPAVSEFTENLRDHMSQKYGPVAVIGGKPAIWLAFSERKVIQLSKTKCSQLLALEEALGKACAADWGDEKLNATVERAAEKVKKTNLETHRVRVAKTTAVEAFVTFESHEDAERAIADSDNFGEFSKQPCALATPAEPGALRWDRLPIQPKEQACRKYGILTATVVILLVGFLGVVQADVWKGNTAYLGGCDDAMAPYEDPADRTVVHHGYCDPFEYPMHQADRINGWQLNMSTVPDAQDALNAYRNGFKQAIASIGAVNLPRAAVPKKGKAKKQLHYPDDYVCAIVEGDDMDGCCTENDNDMTWLEAQEQDCHRIDVIVKDTCTCHTDVPFNSTSAAACPTECTSTEKHSAELFRFGDINAICYMCLCECSNHLDSPSYLPHEPACFDIPEGHQEFCKDYKDYRKAQKKNKLLGTFLVVAVNTIIKTIIVKTQPLMGLHTQSDDMGSTAFRTFLLQFCNTALLVLLLRADEHFPVLDAAPTEKYRNVCAKWYATVGAPLIKTMLINFLAPAVTHFGKTQVVSRLKRWLKEKKAVTQNGLNQAYADSTDDWNLAGAYAELLLPVAVCLVYSSGIPLLLWVATVGLTFKYYVDKCCMLRLYEKPALVNDSMFTQFGGAHGVMSVVLLIKLGLGTWLYASAGGLNPRHEYAGNVMRPYIFPYILMGFAIAIYWAHNSIRADNSDENTATEDLKPFSEAYEQRLMVNKDYDYECDQVEAGEELETAFAEAMVKSAQGAQIHFRQLCTEAAHQVQSIRPNAYSSTECSSVHA